MFKEKTKDASRGTFREFREVLCQVPVQDKIRHQGGGHSRYRVPQANAPRYTNRAPRASASQTRNAAPPTSVPLNITLPRRRAVDLGIFSGLICAAKQRPLPIRDGRMSYISRLENTRYSPASSDRIEFVLSTGSLGVGYCSR